MCLGVYRGGDGYCPHRTQDCGCSCDRLGWPSAGLCWGIHQLDAKRDPCLKKAAEMAAFSIWTTQETASQSKGPTTVPGCEKRAFGNDSALERPTAPRPLAESSPWRKASWTFGRRDKPGGRPTQHASSLQPSRRGLALRQCRCSSALHPLPALRPK